MTYPGLSCVGVVFSSLHVGRRQLLYRQRLQPQLSSYCTKMIKKQNIKRILDIHFELKGPSHSPLLLTWPDVISGQTFWIVKFEI